MFYKGFHDVLSLHFEESEQLGSFTPGKLVENDKLLRFFDTCTNYKTQVCLFPFILFVNGNVTGIVLLSFSFSLFSPLDSPRQKTQSVAQEVSSSHCTDGCNAVRDKL
jgi:hypothetical protein